ncbi:MAG: hypothetical protein HFI09_05020 [Bacilli bacterium]|nr:hypothetical protein [Bacilli bacterium]
MKPIELTKISNKGYQFEEPITFERQIYENTDIRDLKNLVVKGSVTKTLDQDFYLSAHLSGQMILPDSRTLEDVELPLEISIEEKITETNEEIAEYFEKDKNTLDIMGILWENIVLEVPISISTSEKSYQEGNGWELVEEKKESIDPRLAPLRKLLDSEKE